MAKTLTVFIDGIPFDELEKMPFAGSFVSRARLRPTLGYSVNCQTHLFTGKNPDEIGFWCEWTYDPESAPFRRLRPLLKLLSLAEVWYPAKRIVHRFLDKFGPAHSTKNIPLRLLADFAETGHSVLDPGFSHPSLLDHPRMTKFFYWQFPNTPRRDEEIFLAAKRHIQDRDDPEHVFLTMVQVDHCSHWDGVGSAPYDAMLLENDRYIRELSEAYLAKVRDGVVLVASDHGMSNVEHGVDVDLESRFGSPSPSTYAYFVEGTILRVWCEDRELRGNIARHLDGFEGVAAISSEERQEFGITRPEYGDLIYVTDVGFQFVPSFWGPKPSVGMHGHHPRFRGQHGICLSSCEGDFEGEIIDAADFHRVMAGHLAGEQGGA